jgi:hypothetical protein
MTTEFRLDTVEYVKTDTPYHNYLLEYFNSLRQHPCFMIHISPKYSYKNRNLNDFLRSNDGICTLRIKFFIQPFIDDEWDGIIFQHYFSEKDILVYTGFWYNTHNLKEEYGHTRLITNVSRLNQRGIQILNNTEAISRLEKLFKTKT